MAHRVLEKLKSDEFVMKFSFISNPRAVHGALQRSEEVRDLRSALRSGEITDETLRSFTAELLSHLEEGRLFEHELALAAIAVALETRSTAFAEEYVLDLARLELAELPAAIRVAREACRERLKLPGNTTKVVTLSDEEVVPGDWQVAGEDRRVAVGQSEENFELEAA